MSGRYRSFRNGSTADNPAHRRITSQAVSAVRALGAPEAAEDRLAKVSRQRVLAVLAGARVNQFIANQFRQPECVIVLTASKQTSVGSDPGTMILEFQAAVEINPQRLVPRFTRRVRHQLCFQMQPEH